MNASDFTVEHLLNTDYSEAAPQVLSEVLDSLQKEIVRIGFPADMLGRIFPIVRRAVTLGLVRESLETYEVLESAIDFTGYPEDHKKLLLEQANIHGRLAQIDKSLEALDRLERFYGTSLSENEEASVKFTRANVYSHLGHHSKAEPLFLECLQFFRATADKLGQVRTLANLGIVYKNLADYDLALKHYLEAEDILESAESNPYAATIQMNIGIVLRRMGRMADATKALHKAKELGEKLGDVAFGALATQNLGSLYLDTKNFDTAFEQFEQAASILQRTGDSQNLAICFGNQALAALELGRHDLAMELALRSIDTAELIGDAATAARSRAVYATLLASDQFAAHDIEQAERVFQRVLNEFQEQGLRMHEADTHRDISALYERQGKFKNALDHYKKHHEIERGIASNEAEKQAQLVHERQALREARQRREVLQARLNEQSRILHAILPPVIVDRILSGSQEIAERMDSVSVLFADIVGFTTISESMEPERVVELLSHVFDKFDLVASRHGVEKIKTIGDSYMAAAGAPEQCANHADRIGRFALDLIDETENASKELSVSIKVRIGVNSGSVLGGILGRSRFVYDLWGDTVNVASRMEYHSEPNRILCTDAFKQSAPHLQFSHRGVVDIKGKGPTPTWWLTGTGVDRS